MELLLYRQPHTEELFLKLEGASDQAVRDFLREAQARANGGQDVAGGNYGRDWAYVYYYRRTTVASARQWALAIASTLGVSLTDSVPVEEAS